MNRMKLLFSGHERSFFPDQTGRFCGNGLPHSYHLFFTSRFSVAVRFYEFWMTATSRDCSAGRLGSSDRLNLDHEFGEYESLDSEQ